MEQGVRRRKEGHREMLNDIVFAALILAAGFAAGYWACKSKKLNF